MSITKNLKVGKVYVTIGGTVNQNGTIVGWGYDRVKLLCINNNSLIVKTPWETECTVPIDYDLFETPEDDVFWEFKLVHSFIDKVCIPFNEAIKKGICTLRTKITFNDQIAGYFATPQKINEAAKHFSVSYQKIRYTITSLINNGYIIKESEQDGLKAIQLTKGNTK